jgi:hypothetical protein
MLDLNTGNEQGGGFSRGSHTCHTQRPQNKASGGEISRRLRIVKREFCDIKKAESDLGV